MRLCLFTPTFLPLVGGTEFVTDALARAFVSRGHHVVVLAHGEPAELDVPYAVRWYRKPILHRLYPERIGRHLARLHAEERFDLVVSNYGVPTGYAAVRWGRTSGVPVVVVSHGGDLYRSSMRRRHRHLWARIERAYREADGLISISPYIESLIREINPDPALIELIPNGIHLAELTAPAERPADCDDTRPFCLCLGNLGPMKGFDDAIEAYARVREQVRPLAMLIAGDGKLEDELRRRAADLDLGDDVRFLGRRVGEEKRWLLHHCRFGLMPSIEEGHPIVGLEFLAAGKPIVCSMNAAFDGMYDDGVNALRVPARDREQLADAIVRLNGMDLEAMGRASRERAQSCDWSNVADRYLAFFDRVLARKAKSPLGAATGATV